MSKEALVVRPDCTWEIVEINDYRDIVEHIGCRVMTVIPNHNDMPFDMYGDDEALLVDYETIEWNPYASEYYGYREHRQPIAGNVVIMGEVNEEGESTSLDENHRLAIVLKLAQMQERLEAWELTNNV